PCSVTEWPTVTWSATTVGCFSLKTWTTQLSWMFEWGPMRMECTSPRTTAFIQTLAWSPSSTSPMTCAETSTNTRSPSFGQIPLKGRIIAAPGNRGVYQSRPPRASARSPGIGGRVDGVLVAAAGPVGERVEPFLAGRIERPVALADLEDDLARLEAFRLGERLVARSGHVVCAVEHRED